MGRALPIVQHKVDILLNNPLPPALDGVQRQLEMHHLQEGGPLWKRIGRTTCGGAFVDTQYMVGGAFSARTFLQDMAAAGLTMGQLATAFDEAGIAQVGDSIRGHKPTITASSLPNVFSQPDHRDTYKYSMIIAVRAALQENHHVLGTPFWKHLSSVLYREAGYGTFVDTSFLPFGAVDLDKVFTLWSAYPFCVPIWRIADELHAAGIAHGVRVLRLLTGYDPDAGRQAAEDATLAPPVPKPRILSIKLWSHRTGKRTVQVTVGETMAATLAEANTMLRPHAPVVEFWDDNITVLGYTSLVHGLKCYGATAEDVQRAEAGLV